MEDVEEGTIPIEEVADLMVCWNPGKKAMTQDLEQGSFSIKDSIVTRQQLAMTPILIKRAAECIVDFCPDLLWRGMLLRITSEAGYGNKQVRDRMCLNGNYCDKATITKRIGSALGQKQQQSGSRRLKPVQEPSEGPMLASQSGEKFKASNNPDEVYYNENVLDFGDYVYFFGHRTSHRSQLQMNQTGLKRKRMLMGAGQATAAGPSKRVVEVEDAIQSPAAMTSDAAEDSAAEGDDSDGEGQGDGDAVSVQSDTILDMMDED